MSSRPTFVAAPNPLQLWEHADRIRGGELGELASLLVLCEDTPTERVLHEERELILGLEVEQKTRAEMLAVAIAVGGRYFPKSLLQTIFREELQMLKEASIVEEWIEEAAEAAREKAMTEGRAEGRAEEAPTLLITMLQRKFGELPESVVARVEREGPEWCHDVAVRLLTATSLADLGL